MDNLRTLIVDFANRLQVLIEADALDRARAAVLTAMGMPAPKRVGRPSKHPAAWPLVAPSRRMAPKQLCPVPRCKNAAAPIFGMVCAKHKGLPKTVIKKYREARKAKKLRAAA